VQVTFRTTRLAECYTNSTTAQREWGDKVARRYIERVNILKASRSTVDLQKIPSLRFHPMKGNKEGRHSITLVDRWRMEVSFQDRALTIVRVEEVSAHYGD
jgi:proteic killer suppression protein